MRKTYYSTALLTFFIVLVTLPALCMAQFYRCITEDGSVSISDYPCADDAEVVQRGEYDINSRGEGTPVENRDVKRQHRKTLPQQSFEIQSPQPRKEEAQPLAPRVSHSFKISSLSREIEREGKKASRSRNGAKIISLQFQIKRLRGLEDAGIQVGKYDSKIRSLLSQFEREGAKYMRSRNAPKMSSLLSEAKRLRSLEITESR